MAHGRGTRHRLVRKHGARPATDRRGRTPSCPGEQTHPTPRTRAAGLAGCMPVGAHACYSSYVGVEYHTLSMIIQSTRTKLLTSASVNPSEIEGIRIFYARRGARATMRAAERARARRRVRVRASRRAAAC